MTPDDYIRAMLPILVHRPSYVGSVLLNYKHAEPYTPNAEPYPSWDFVRLALDVALPLVHDTVPDLTPDWTLPGGVLSMIDISGVIWPVIRIMESHSGPHPGRRMAFDANEVEATRAAYLAEVAERTNNDLEGIRADFLAMVDSYQDMVLHFYNFSRFGNAMPKDKWYDCLERGGWRQYDGEHLRGNTARRGFTLHYLALMVTCAGGTYYVKKEDIG